MIGAKIERLFFYGVSLSSNAEGSKLVRTMIKKKITDEARDGMNRRPLSACRHHP
jgi:hypothetical protein